MAYVKVNGAALVRDTNSMGLSNVDISAKQEYYAKVQVAQAQKQEINNIKSEVIALRSDINDIKELLQGLVNKHV